jgi:ribosomal protein L9
MGGGGSKTYHHVEYRPDPGQAAALAELQRQAEEQKRQQEELQRQQAARAQALEQERQTRLREQQAAGERAYRAITCDLG